MPHQSKKYKKRINKEILKTTREQQWIVHGARALNKQLPKKLYRKTDDWDFFSDTPKKSSILLEREIENEIGMDAYKQDQLPIAGGVGTVYRVISKETGEEIADFMKTPNHPNLYTTISGIRWETLEHAKLAYRRILSNPACIERWDKARRDLNRIEIFERKINKKTSRKTISKSEIPEPFVMVRVPTVSWG